MTINEAVSTETTATERRVVDPAGTLPLGSVIQNHAGGRYLLLGTRNDMFLVLGVEPNGRISTYDTTISYTCCDQPHTVAEQQPPADVVGAALIGWAARKQEAAAETERSRREQAESLAERMTEVREQVSNLRTEVGSMRRMMTINGEEYDVSLQTIWDRLVEEAEARDWCGEFDRVMEDLGLPGRTKDYTVTVRYSGTFTISGITARSADDAESIVNNWPDRDIWNRLQECSWSDINEESYEAEDAEEE